MLSLAARLRHRLARVSPIPLAPLRFGQGLSVRHDLARVGIVPAVVVDVGANVGQSAYEFARAFPGARIHCFEPVAATFAELERTVRSLQRVACHRLALGDAPGEAPIHVHAQSGMSSLAVAEGERTETVTVARLDDVAADLELGRIDLLKVDVEGHEAAVLRGAAGLLAAGRVRALLVEVGFSGTRHTPVGDVREALAPHGFVVTGYHDQRSDPATGRLRHANALFVQPPAA